MRFFPWKIPALTCVSIVSLLLSPAASAQGTAHQHHHNSSQECHPLPGHQVGKAMYYGESFNGRTMANGQPFDMNALTAASRTLPLGTKVKVTNLHTKKSVTVTITDRGRLRAKNVILDLSAGSARAIGLTEHEGVAPVSIEPVGFNGKSRKACA